MARAAPMLVSKLQRSSHGGVGEATAEAGKKRGTRESDITIWEDKSVPAHAMDLDSSSLKVFELGKLVLSSGLLHSSWSKISEIHKSTSPNQQRSGLGIKIYQQDKYTLVVFDAPPILSSNSASTLLSGSQDDNPFHFLFSENISSFSLHTPAYKLFDSAYKRLSELKELKSKLLQKLKANKSVIITGAALGGSVASLFTLWLLETIEPKLKRPLCITFGSPLIGDASLQQILDHSVWNSCFLHVADATQQTPITAGFKPFGTFLICFDSQCICIEDPDAVLELLTGDTNTDLLGWRDYGEVLRRLDQSSMADSSLKSMVLSVEWRNVRSCVLIS
ncbi:unnamed protein product [Microthlaspi erraticum]|uniref:Fungal lipase-type domain-containing protein n=1 Tax=Microthlaspi erraticum TaxID=1685480 RepID=A0A6D2IXL4_9BRAS|nr:unnamed protein product [Microthlaspi erraticum]